MVFIAKVRNLRVASRKWNFSMNADLDVVRFESIIKAKEAFFVSLVASGLANSVIFG